MAGETRYMDIYDHLIAKGFDVYTPAQHKGECVTPYIVVKGAGMNQAGNYSSNQHLYDILCYVPKDQYTYLEKYVEMMEFDENAKVICMNPKGDALVLKVSDLCPFPFGEDDLK